MKYFVTGANGWIGSASVAELVAAGHQVVGLARSDEGLAEVESLGATAVRGDLTDPTRLAELAADSDGVVHLAYHHDFSQMAEAAAYDQAAIEAMGDSLAGSDRPLLIASGVAGLSLGRPATEQDAPDPATHPRVANAARTLALADRGVRSMVARFAPTVHGTGGDHGFIAVLVGVARERGVAAYIGDGANRWPAVNRLDAGALVAKGIQAAPAGSVLHAVGEEGIATKDIAEAIGRGLGLPTQSVPPEQAAEHFGWIGMFFGMDCPASSAATQALLDWQPTHPGLIADIEAGAYF